MTSEQGPEGGEEGVMGVSGWRTFWAEGSNIAKVMWGGNKAVKVGTYEASV